MGRKNSLEITVSETRNGSKVVWARLNGCNCFTAHISWAFDPKKDSSKKDYKTFTSYMFTHSFIINGNAIDKLMKEIRVRDDVEILHDFADQLEEDLNQANRLALSKITEEECCGRFEIC